MLLPASLPPSTMRMRWPDPRTGGLGMTAIAYVAIDYLRHVSPGWHERLQPVLWTVLALVVVSRIPFYKHWSTELRSAMPFLGSLIFMLLSLLLESISVRFVTAVLGVDWHRWFDSSLCLHLFYGRVTLFELITMLPTTQMKKRSNLWYFTVWVRFVWSNVIWVDCILPCFCFSLSVSSSVRDILLAFRSSWVIRMFESWLHELVHIVCELG